MRLLLIVNPTASSMTRRRRLRVQHLLGEHHRLEVAETYRRGHATRLARAAARDGIDVVAVLAGDGTLNETADGLVGSTTALAPLPGGSTNVFARTLGIENSIIPATEQLIESLAHGSIRRGGVGIANGRHFLFHLGAGFDAQVIERVERHHWIKRWLAHTTFAATALSTFFRRVDRDEPPFRVDGPDGEEIGTGQFAIVSNTSPYAYFGARPLTVTPHAALDRPLALTLFPKLDTGPTLSAVASAIGSGKRIARSRRVVQMADLPALTFVARRGPFPWQVDGDYLGEVERLEVRYRPDALSFVVPVPPAPDD
ncbi:MAG TPA: diacylglycerol kinase family protein [Acidimicrobiia bacterium]|nr:diacylglycerol kinase family protein [Acidimicrobiia bacterium]